MASYASKQNTAIDYSRFAPQYEAPEAPAPQIEVLPKARQSKSTAKARVPYGKYAVMCLCIFAVLGAIIFSYMTVNELTVQNDRLQNQITALESRENALNAKKEQLYSLAFVEEYAKTVLGMVKLDKTEVRYIELQNPERMTVAQPDTGGAGALASLSKSFSAVLEYLS